MKDKKLNLIELQEFIFDKNPSRLELLAYKSENSNSKAFNVAVYRNHSFELAQSAMGAFLDYARLRVNFSYSDYDDSLSFLNLDLSADLVLLWLDLSRYENADISSFLRERIEYLKGIYKGKILLVPSFANFEFNDEQVAIFDTKKLEKKLGKDFVDLRLESFSGTKLSPKALIEISKDLGLNYLPALLLPNIKAVVFDLDNTLYKGVLGEDGISGITLTAGHKHLQELAVQLNKKGFFICLASKNDEKDVLEMFEKRKDFPLRLENITKHCISWRSKVDAISEITQFLNIGIDSVLFVDDNFGEVLSIISAYPSIKAILAQDDGFKTAQILSNYPCMMKLKTNDEDAIRSNDTQANKERTELQQSLSREDYLKSLQISLTYSLNDLKDAPRVAELANKTNQFICTYKRYTLAQVEQLMSAKDSLIITTRLQDRLSQSGIIGVSVFENKGDFAQQVECFVSCRALGRGLDEAIVLLPIKLALKRFGKDKIKIDFIKGERNAPAKDYLNANLAEFLSTPSEFKKEIETTFFQIQIRE